MQRPLFLILAFVLAFSLDMSAAQSAQETPEPTLLTDPFLQLPTEDAVRVVWFTEFEGAEHFVLYGEDLETRADAQTTKLSRVAEDEDSRVAVETSEETDQESEPAFEGYTPRDVWRHEALVTGLTGRAPYRAVSVTEGGTEGGTEVASEPFTLAPLPEAGEPLQILLTSDHQLKEMTPANLEKVEETVGRVDAIFLAGDLVNIPDRASEWFDDARGFAFFPGLQGNAAYTLERTLEEDGLTTTTTRTYGGGELIQHAPLFPVIGNHEVMGRFSEGTGLNAQFNDPQPEVVAEARYESLADVVNPSGDEAVRARWLEDNSFNTITYEEIFTLPEESSGGERYYALQFGDVYLIGLYATRIWRTPSLNDDARGKYREPLAELDKPDNWGYGDFIFEDLSLGSEQHKWLEETLKSDAFKDAPYKIVMLHQGPHGLGDNYNPVFADPVQVLDYDEAGRLAGVRYEYPLEADVLVRDVEPLLNAAGVDLTFSGHSHLWFRMQNEANVNFLETSNVGNSYGCYLEGYRERGNVPNDPRYTAANYAAVGDPHGLEPIMPTIEAPMTDDEGAPLPCVASNDLTVFSILDTGTGSVKSYTFDTRRPEFEVVLFDEFSLEE